MESTLKITGKRMCAVLLTLLTIIGSCACLFSMSYVSAEAASLPAEVKGGKTVSQVLGMDAQTYLNWLKSHEKDNYYLGTPYEPYDHRNPNGDCSGAYGSLDKKGVAAMNCTGFVWHVLYKATKDSNGNTSIIPAMKGWYNFYKNNNINRKYFSSKSSMLKSGYLEKGDIIWMYENGEGTVSDYNHIGIYWGDGKSDVFWQSVGGGNMISDITPITSAPLYVVIKMGKNKVPALSLNVNNLSLGKGETYKLTSNKTASFKSSNTSVATVDGNGKITAKTNGTSTITAKCGSQSAKCTVTVKNAPSSVSLNKTSLTLGVGETYDLNSKLPSGTASRSVKYTSSNTKVATVKAAGGLVTAKATGTATITATTFNGKKATCKITVKKAPSSVSLNKTELTLGIGETFDLNSKLPSGTASRVVSYKSSNPSVASVKAAGGLVTAKATGTATITATTFNGKKATCKITVKKAPSSVLLNKTELTLGVGETFDLNSKLPTGTASRVVSYKSSNPSVASVKAAGGLVTAKATGTATITATTFNGKTATCAVTVFDARQEADTEKIPVKE